MGDRKELGEARGEAGPTLSEAGPGPAEDRTDSGDRKYPGGGAEFRASASLALWEKGRGGEAGDGKMAPKVGWKRP